jgi:hypothetical protein
VAGSTAQAGKRSIPWTPSRWQISRVKYVARAFLCSGQLTRRVGRIAA